MVSPTHHPRPSSLSSAESVPTSPVRLSAYEQMLNGSASYVRNSPILHAQPAIDGVMMSPREEPVSPLSTTRQVVSVVARDHPASPPGHVQLVTSPGPPSPMKYTRKPHAYDLVKFPHRYEDVEYLGDEQQQQLSRVSSKSEAKLNSKWSRSSKKSELENGSKSASVKHNNMHLSDSRLNKITRRRVSDKPPSAKKSPSSTKRFSTGFFTTERSEVRRRENSSDFVKAKYRVSNPDPRSYMMSQQFHYGDMPVVAAAGEGRVPEEELTQEDDGCFGDFERVR